MLFALAPSQALGVALAMGVGSVTLVAGTVAVARARTWGLLPMHDALFDTRVDSEEAAIALATRLGLEASVTAVPTFFVNGRLVRGAPPADELQKIIDDQRP